MSALFDGDVQVRAQTRSFRYCAADGEQGRIWFQQIEAALGTLLPADPSTEKRARSFGWGLNVGCIAQDDEYTYMGIVPTQSSAWPAVPFRLPSRKRHPSRSDKSGDASSACRSASQALRHLIYRKRANERQRFSNLKRPSTKRSAMAPQHICGSMRPRTWTLARL